MKKLVKQWERLKSEIIFKSKLFRFRVDECRVFDGRIMPKYFVMEFPDWVQVVAVDAIGHVIMVNQYRYPGKDWFLEFPGGSTNSPAGGVGIKSGDVSSDRDSDSCGQQEDPMLAAQRELQEETGYTSERWEYVGHHYPNPALLSNKCHVFVARDCKKTADQNLDQFEDLEVVKVPLSAIEQKLQSGKFHSLMLATWGLARGKLNV